MLQACHCSTQPLQSLPAVFQLCMCALCVLNVCRCDGEYDACADVPYPTLSVFIAPVGVQELAKMADDGKLKSVITDNVFQGLDKAPEAFAKLESGRATGKVVVTI